MSIPISTAPHDTAAANTTTSSVPSRKPSSPPVIRKPSSRPSPIISSRAHTCLARSAVIRPISGADRAIGRLRSRSKTPLVRSVLSAIAVYMVMNRVFCTMIPGSAYFRYASGDPAICPPSTYVNRNTNMIGVML